MVGAPGVEAKAVSGKWWPVRITKEVVLQALERLNNRAVEPLMGTVRTVWIRSAVISEGGAVTAPKASRARYKASSVRPGSPMSWAARAAFAPSTSTRRFDRGVAFFFVGHGLFVFVQPQNVA